MKNKHKKNGARGALRGTNISRLVRRGLSCRRVIVVAEGSGEGCALPGGACCGLRCACGGLALCDLID